MEPKEKAKELIETFLPKVYCFMGSGMLTNDYDFKVALSNAKACSENVVGNMFKELDEIYPNKDGKWGLRTDYWQEVSTEIYNYDIYEQNDN